MSAARPARSVHLMAWFGWSGAPAAWAALHVFGFGVTQAACNGPGREVPVNGLALATMLGAAAIAIAAGVSAVLAFRATEGAEGLPGEERCPQVHDRPVEVEP